MCAAGLRRIERIGASSDGRFPATFRDEISGLTLGWQTIATAQWPGDKKS